MSETLNEIIRKIPKVELHLHYSGAVPLRYLKSVSSDVEYELLVQGLKKLANGVDYHDVFKYFSHVYKILNTYEKIENGLIAIATEQLQDNVVYLEVRTGLKDLGKGTEEYLCALLRGIKRCPAAITVKLMLSLRRNTPVKEAKDIVGLAIKYRKEGVVGIDVSGDSTLVGIEKIIPAIELAKKDCLLLSLHLGESREEIDTPAKKIAQAKLLEIIKPDRIGHGVFLSQQSVAWLLQHPNIPIEVCPSSSVLAGMIEHHSKHPGLGYHLNHKHLIVVGTDDPLLFQTTLTKEYLKLLEHSLSLDQVKQIIANSFRFAFATNDLKQKNANRCNL